jgi:hypothetical protein
LGVAQRVAGAAANIILRQEARALAAEAEAAQWKARWGVLFKTVALREGAEHQIKTGHAIAIDPEVVCTSCSWARRNPYIPTPKPESASA